MSTINNIKELKQAIRKAKAVYASVLISNSDSSYIQVVKADILFQIKEWNDVELSFCRLDSENNLYIN